MPQTNPLRPSQIPHNLSPRAVHDWVQLAVQEGQSILSNEPTFNRIDDVMRGILGDLKDDPLRPQGISGIRLNHLSRVRQDLSSSLTDIKPFWEYRTTNTRFEPQADMGQKLASAWWTGRGIDLKFYDCINYALVAGSAFPHLIWDNTIGDQNIIPEDPRDVLPIRPSDMISVQNAFGVVIRRERPVNYLRNKYPQFANRIHADRDNSIVGQGGGSRVQRIVEQLSLRSGFMQNLISSLGSRVAAQNLKVPTSDEYTVYVKDDSVNETGEDQIMGDPSTNWSYKVRPGEALYPRKRLIVMTQSCAEPLYDGPNPYWHGLFPCPKLTLDPLPWSWLGKAPLTDLLPVQREIDRTARGISDLLEKVWRPDLIGDKNAVSKQLMDKIDTRRAGLKLRTNPVAGQGIKYEYGPIEKLAPAIEWLNLMFSQMKELSGTEDMTDLAELGQVPASETVERMLMAKSSAIRLRSRMMESFMRELAMMVLMNFFQFYDAPRRLAALGPNGLTFEDVDFDPGTLIPDMLDMGLMDNWGNPLPRHERALKFISYFSYHIAPGSLLAASGVTDKLMMLQLTRMGACDFLTLLQKLDINNIAPANILEQAGDTIMERLQWQQTVGLGMQVGPAGASAAGRKATGQAMPRMKISESG